MNPKYFKLQESIVNNENNPSISFIEGDNLDTISKLLHFKKNSFDVVYVDPPYNTQNNLTYFDKKSNFEWKKSVGQRLYNVRKLMTDSAIICFSCSAIMYYHSKDVLNNVFGEENSIADIVVVTNKGGRTDAKFISNTHEYLLVYSKDSSKAVLNDILVDSNSNQIKYELLRKTGHNSKKEDRPNLHYPIYFDIPTKKLYLDNVKDGLKPIFPKTHNGKDGCWRWKKETVEQNLDNLVVRLNRQKEYDIYQVKESKPDSKKYMKPKSVWDMNYCETRQGKKDLQYVDNSLEFDYPKPVELMKNIVRMSGGSSANILDIYSGSGTTGQAVMELNEEDGGSRNVVLCTNNEPIIKLIIKDLYNDGHLPKQSMEAFNTFQNEQKDLVSKYLTNENYGIARAIMCVRIKTLLPKYSMNYYHYT